MQDRDSRFSAEMLELAEGARSRRDRVVLVERAVYKEAQAEHHGDEKHRC